jgi:hypothetical protein
MDKTDKNNKNKNIAVKNCTNLFTSSILCLSTDELENQKNKFENGYLCFNTDTMKLQIFYDGDYIDI